jgi:hypothetical protein
MKFFCCNQERQKLKMTALDTSHTGKSESDLAKKKRSIHHAKKKSKLMK